MATKALHALPHPVACSDGDEVRRPTRTPPAEPPWYEAPEFRALAAARRAFILKGVPPATVRLPEAAARHTAFWTLYELGHALDEIERRTREGAPCWSRVRVSEHGPGRVVIHIAIEPIPEPTSTAGTAETGGRA